jgi:hypothetical protein
MVSFNDVLEFIKKEYRNLIPSGSSGYNGDIKKHEIMPRDYLSFCDHELDKNVDTLESKINIISNLKRAFDCELDIFFDFLKINDLIKERNLGLNTRIGFIHQIGLFPKRSIVHIETIRNKIEHEFKKPEIYELEVYYDLVYAFILVIEKQIALFMSMSEIEHTLGSYFQNEEYGVFRIGYNYEKMEIYVKYRKESEGIKSRYSISIKKSVEEFIKAFRLFILIQQNECKVNDEFTINEIMKI